MADLFKLQYVKAAEDEQAPPASDKPKRIALSDGQIDAIADLIQRYLRNELQYGDGFEWFFQGIKDTFNDVLPSIQDDVVANLRNSRWGRNRAHLLDQVEDIDLFEMIKDNADFDGDNLFVTLYKFESGEDERDIGDLVSMYGEPEELKGVEYWNMDDYSIKLIENSRSYSYQNLYFDIARVGDYVMIRYDTGFEVRWGLTESGLDSIEEQLESAADDAANSVPQVEERGPATDKIVYKVQHPKFAGFYLADLPANALTNEGDAQSICVGDPDQGYIGLVYQGKLKIMSLRYPTGKTLMTFEFDIDGSGAITRCKQIKGKANRLPGFDKAYGRDKKFIKPQEVEVALEILEHFKIDPERVNDMQDPLRAYNALKQGTKPESVSSYFASLADFENHVHCGFCNHRYGSAAYARLDRLANILESENHQDDVIDT